VKRKCCEPSYFLVKKRSRGMSRVKTFRAIARRTLKAGKRRGLKKRRVKKYWGGDPQQKSSDMPERGRQGVA